jgi:hypothetical protein
MAMMLDLTTALSPRVPVASGTGADQFETLAPSNGSGLAEP